MVTAMGVSMGLTAAAIMSRGHHRPEGAVGARPAHARQDRRVGHHRARLGLRRVRVDAVDGPARRRRVRAQRLEDVHHQRSVRRHDRVHLQARRGQPARRAQGPDLRPRHGHARARAVEAAAQDGHALVADGRAVPRRRAGRPRPADRRDRGRRRPAGATAAKATFLHGALRRGGDGARHHRAVPRAVASHYAKDRVQFGQPIGEFQLIQLKLAKMEVARLNVAEPRVPLHRDASAAGQAADASPRRRP